LICPKREGLFRPSFIETAAFRAGDAPEPIYLSRYLPRGETRISRASRTYPVRRELPLTFRKARNRREAVR